MKYFKKNQYESNNHSQLRAIIIRNLLYLYKPIALREQGFKRNYLLKRGRLFLIGQETLLSHLN